MQMGEPFTVIDRIRLWSAWAIFLRKASKLTSIASNGRAGSLAVPCTMEGIFQMKPRRFLVWLSTVAIGFLHSLHAQDAVHKKTPS